MKPHEPDPALKVSDYLDTPTGFLVAYDSGEFGGELSSFDRAGHLTQAIADGNVIRILKTPEGILALAGVAHLTLDRGSILKTDGRTSSRSAPSSLSAVLMYHALPRRYLLTSGFPGAAAA